jgi:hypothetical protein
MKRSTLRPIDRIDAETLRAQFALDDDDADPKVSEPR